jgi:hypothetical protein
VVDRIEGDINLVPERNPMGTATSDVAIEPVAVSDTQRAVELLVQGAWRYDEEGGHSRFEETRILYLPMEDDLVELVRAESTGDSSAETDEAVTSSYELQPAGQGGLYDVVVTRRKVTNSWPDDQHSDVTEVERRAWNGNGYEVVESYSTADEAGDEAADEGADD